MKHRKKGFTLIELVVVIAIVGILAAILVPVMMGYIRKSRVSAANTNAKQNYNTALEVVTSCGAESSGYLSESRLSVPARKTSLQSKLSSTSDPIMQSYYQEMINQLSTDDKGYYGGLYVGNVPVAVVWSNGNTDSAILGRYPDTIGTDDSYTWSDWENDCAQFQAGGYTSWSDYRAANGG
ncbi:pilin [Ruminococcus sp.]|uniref:pilin n=1 Tax=Ruminococcus sp. TaxID=41978 RepID=UPI0025E7AF5A|nr:type II secretion system protein [uncultured Ruminococcus sp.]